VKEPGAIHLEHFEVNCREIVVPRVVGLEEHRSGAHSDSNARGAITGYRRRTL